MRTLPGSLPIEQRGLAALLTLLALLLLAGCGMRSNSVELTREETASATGLTALTLRADNAAIEVEGWDRPEVSARATFRASAGSGDEARERLATARLVLRRDGSTLRVETELPPNRATVQSLHLRVPVALALELQTTNGAIAVRGTSGAVTARTDNGALNVTDARGALTLTATNGAIAVRLARGAGATLDLQTTNGAVSAPGSEGNRQVRGPVGGGGPNVTARTTNGSIRVTTS
jgi:hypothetical protein